MTHPKASEPQDMAWGIGQLLFDRYRVEGLLGRGGMGEVYRVYHPAWQVEMAVKRLAQELTGDVRSMDRFARECQTWADLDLHPYIATCYFIRKLEDRPLIFMEYLDGGSLEAWIAEGRLYETTDGGGVQRILDIAIQIAWGLSFSHQAGIVHQDVKPANVLLTRFGTAKVADFGLARARQVIEWRRQTNADWVHVTGSGMTPAFASPEQANGERLTPASDVWSWGLTVLTMFTGSVNWRSGTAAPAVLGSLKGAIDGRGLEMPAGVRDLLGRCFVTDPEKRLQDLNAVAAELSQLYFDLTGAFYFREQPDAARAPGNRRHVASLNNRAISLIELDASEKAYQLLSNAQVAASAGMALEKMPELQEVAFNRVLLQIQTNPLFEAKEAPNLVPAEPDSVKHLYLVGLLLLAGGELDSAIDFLGDVVVGESSYRVPALVARSVALLLKGETEPALLALRYVQNQDETDVEVLQLLALAEYLNGRSVRALKLFERASAATVPGSRTRAEYAILLARCGLTKSAAHMGKRALQVPHRDPAVLLHAAELSFGAQTFLPAVAPVPTLAGHPRALVLECLQREHQNLRAAVDAATLPQRFPLRLRDKAVWRRRVLPEASEPVALLGHAKQSHGSLVRHGRWGQLPASNTRTVAMLIAAVIALAVSWGLWNSFLEGPLLADANSATSRLSKFALVTGLWVVLGVIFLRPVAANSLLASTGTMCVALPLSLWLPSLVHHLYLRHAAGIDVPSISEQYGSFLGRFILILSAIFFVREFVYQRLVARLRAFGGFRQAFAPDVLNSLWTFRHGGPRIRQGRWHTPIYVAAFALVTSWPGRVGPQIRLRYEHFRAKFGLWQLALIPEIFVVAIADTMWLSREPGLIFGYFVTVFAAHLVLLLWAALAPRFVLVANVFVIPAVVGLLTAELTSAVTLGTAAFSLILVGVLEFFNLVAILYCPAFAPLVRGPLAGWDLQSVVDPLNLRQRVVFWRLLSGEGSVNPMNPSELNRWDF